MVAVRVGIALVVVVGTLQGGFTQQVKQETAAAAAAATSAAPDLREELRPGLEAFVKSFNSGDATAIAGAFLDDGEFVTEAGEVHSGRTAVEALMKQYFASFPKAELSVEVETIRRLGTDLLIEEGTREVVVPDEATPPVRLRYIAIRAKQGNDWKYATVREFSDDPEPTPADHLSALAWLEGDWVNEGTDATIKLNFHWTEDGNYLMGEYETFVQGESQGKATQRFGWDAVHGQIRSWLFEADGTFSEATWSPTADGWTCKSSTIMPDGLTGSATMRIIVKGNDQFILRGNDRVIGGEAGEDYEVQIVRQPTVGGGQGK